MAASQRVQVLSDRVTELSILAQYLANPKLIDELKAEVMALNTLTVQETAKMNDARAFMAKYDEMSAAYNNKVDVLESDRKTFDKSVADLVDKIEAVNRQSTENAEKLAALTAVDKALGEARATLNQAAADMDTRHADEWAKIQAAKDDIEKMNGSLTVERVRLASVDKALREKADKIKGLVAD